MRVDEEMDFHSFSRDAMLWWLEDTWSRRRWHGLRRIRVIHGKGEVLPGALRDWCDQKGIPWATESGNPGATIIRPASRETHSAPIVHRPLKHIRNHAVPSPPPIPPPPPEPADTELFEQAIAEIEGSERRRLHRKKHAED